MQENFVTVDNHRIRYLEHGNHDKTLVLIHGLGASAERWARVIPKFANHYNVIAPDLIGFGLSDKPEVDYTPKFFTHFLKKFFDVLEIGPVYLIGSSLGGQIAASFTSQYHDLVEKLILVSPSGMMKHSTPALDSYIMAALFPNERNARTAFKTMESSGRRIDKSIVTGFVQRMKLPNAKLAFMSTLLGLKDAKLITKKLEKIIVPTLIIWGSKDPVIPIRYADYFTSSIPNCTFHIINNCGHTPYVQMPEIFSNLTLDFLRQHLNDDTFQ